MDLNDPTKGDYETLLKVHGIISEKLASAFPNTMILPALGNNDTKYHYQAPDDTNG